MPKLHLSSSRPHHPRRRGYGPFLFPAVLIGALAASACSSAESVSVEPETANVLTCTTKPFTATVSHAGESPAVTWSVAGGGTVDATGLYTAPNQVPTPAQAVLTATSSADSEAVGRATISLSTALPGTAVAAGGTYDRMMIHHAFTSRGGHTYGVLAPRTMTSGPSTYALKVVASSDGGKTFGAPVVATDISDASISIICPSIAIDAGDPNTVYVAYMFTAGEFTQTAAATGNDSGMTLALAVSTNAGQTWKNYVLESHVSGWGECPDVLSPSAGTVVAEAPTFAGVGGLTFYVDNNKGAGFASGAGGTGYVTNEHFFVTTRHWVSYDEGTESPRLFSGANNATCVVYRGGDSADEKEILVQCSADGKTGFSPPIVVDTLPSSGNPHHPTAATRGGTVAVAYWVDDNSTSELRLALSTNGGATFGAPTVLSRYVPPEGLRGWAENPAIAWDASGTLWLAYLVDDGGPKRLIVDKSCDGKTWSGAQLINGPEGSVTTDYGWPGLLADGAVSVYSPRHVDALQNEEFDVIRLTP